MLIKPPALRPGDTVGVVAPASPFRADSFERGLAELRALGFTPKWDPGVFTRARYLSGTPARRAAEIQAFFADPAVKGIFCARGGYGSAHIIPLLDASVIARAPKPVVGCSDVTSLLLYVTGPCGVTAFHGPMVAGQLAEEGGGYDRASLLASLTSPLPRELDVSGVEVLREGNATGRLVGGCLSQLAAAVGTPYALPEEDAVLFVEDVNERPYRIDRMLTQLAHAGVLERAGGIVFGQMINCCEAGGSPAEIHSVIADVLKDFRGPLAFGLPSGHTDRPALTLPLGVACRLRCDGRRVSLALLEGGVAG